LENTVALFCKECKLSKQHCECLSNWIASRHDKVWAFLTLLTTMVQGNYLRLHTVAALPPESEVTAIVPLEPIWVPRPLDGSTKLTVLYLYIQQHRNYFWKNNNTRSFATGGSLLNAVHLDALTIHTKTLTPVCWRRDAVWKQ
jgi:hypothetical protein